MRHRRRGRKLGRSPSHRRAMLRNLASSLFLTERDAEFEQNTPKSKGRVVTTLPKAKEVRPLVEKCITIARRSLEHEERAEEYATDADRGSEEWKSWRASDQWQQWCDARAPAIAARRHALRLLGDKEAVRILFEEIAPRFADREGGYTRVLRLATPRLGDAGTRAVLELVGVHDRTTVRSEKPAFADDTESEDAETEDSQTGAADEQADTEQHAVQGGAADDAEPQGDAGESPAADSSDDQQQEDADKAKDS